MTDRCIATRPGLREASQHQCRKPQWGGTDFCYQHAIQHREAVVVTPLRLLQAMVRAGYATSVGDAHAKGVALWRALTE
jgi:hypothetical protein